MELYKHMEIKDLPKELREYAESNGINSIQDFTVNHLWNLFGDVGCNVYFKKLSSNKEYLIRLIKEKYPNECPDQLHKMFKVSFNYAYELYREAHQTAHKEREPDLFAQYKGSFQEGINIKGNE